MASFFWLLWRWVVLGIPGRRGRRTASRETKVHPPARWLESEPRRKRGYLSRPGGTQDVVGGRTPCKTGCAGGRSKRRGRRRQLDWKLVAMVLAGEPPSRRRRAEWCWVLGGLRGPTTCSTVVPDERRWAGGSISEALLRCRNARTLTALSQR